MSNPLRMGFVIGLFTFFTQAFAGWELQFENAIYGLCGLSFVDTLKGWAVGGQPNGPGRIIRTADGGETWKWLDYETPCPLGAVCFVDSLYGWAVGFTGTIIHTKDGGLTWSVQMSDTTKRLWDVIFVNKNRGWVCGLSVILHTTNGGKEWIEQSVTIGGREICFVDQNHGWIIGEGMLHTSNGGATWETQEITIPGSLRTCLSISFVDASNGWATAWSFYNSEERRWILRTTNGGDTWEIQDSTIGAGKIHFIDLNNGWTVYGGYDIYYTTNGGETWNLQCASPGVGYINELSFPDLNHG